MNPLGIGAIVETVGNIADDLFTSDEERLKHELETYKVDASLLQGQHAVNVEEAKHDSVFVAGARPAILWVGAVAMAWTFIAHPMLVWAWALMQAKDWIPKGLEPPPTLDADALWVILSGILGISGMRSFDKRSKRQPAKAGG
jgi:hypothetical protein